MVLLLYCLAEKNKTSLQICMKVGTIENNHTLRQRVLSALKTGGIQALGQILNHPAATFVIAALEDWQKSQN